VKLSGLFSTLALALLACALLLASGCGDGDDDDSDGAATPPSETASTAADGETPPAGETPSDGATPGQSGATDDGPAQGSETSLTAILTNTPFSITLSEDTVPAGRVQILVTNEGTVGHNFWLIRTDLAADDLPVTNNVVNVNSLDVVANSGLVTNDEDIEPGDTLEVQLPELEAGAYVVICNVPDHYSAGMQASLTAQ
jgi:uncharacterized cupredoxin-like copper-binding protein